LRLISGFRSNPEGWAYIGLSTIVVGLIVLGRIILARAKKQPVRGPDFPVQSQWAFWASLLVLLFAFGMPFKLYAPSIDLFPLVKSFRATGRFAWPFFYIATTLGMVWVYHWGKKCWDKKKTLAAMVIWTVFPLFMMVEAIPYHRDMSQQINQSPNYFSQKRLNPDQQVLLSGINPNDYQAILPLPYYHQGSESYLNILHNGIVRESMVMAYHSGIPLISGVLARTSIPESKQLAQIVTPNFYPKPIAAKFTDPRPILILKSDEVPLTEWEQRIFDRAESLAQAVHLELAAILVKDLFKDEIGRENVKYTGRRKAYELFWDGQYWRSDSLGWVLRQNFDDLEGEISYQGNGAYNSMKYGYHLLAEIPADSFPAHETYHLSVWMHNGVQDALNMYFRLLIQEIDPAGGVARQSTVFPDRAEVIDGNWSMVESVFPKPQAGHLLRVVCLGQEGKKTPFAADELLIRSVGTDVYQGAGPGVLWKNNHWLARSRNKAVN
ncbi:MAG: hypothetical protein AAF206_26110, partial [Bacteroidota bacterium]